jgi:3-isopropylmalate/(R)-2-methylmalate dehydratase small subunit
MTPSGLALEGRVWRFGDNINTDLIFPNKAFQLPLTEQHRLVFSANRPGWVDQVVEGDLIIAGHNFGTGSSRVVGRVLKNCGIAGLVAESLNGLCLRSCVTFSFPAIECPGVTGLFDEGQRARVDFVSGTVENLTSGRALQGRGLPPLLLETILAGGVVPMLAREGYIEVQERRPPNSKP